MTGRDTRPDRLDAMAKKPPTTLKPETQLVAAGRDTKGQALSIFRCRALPAAAMRGLTRRTAVPPVRVEEVIK